MAAASAGDSLASIAASADVAVGKDNMFIRPVWIAVRWLGSPPSSRFTTALKTVLMQRGSKLQGRRQRCRAVIAHRHRLEADAAGFAASADASTGSPLIRFKTAFCAAATVPLNGGATCRDRRQGHVQISFHLIQSRHPADRALDH